MGGPLKHIQLHSIKSAMSTSRVRCAVLMHTQSHDTYSPLSLLVARLRYIAMAVPIMANNTMAPIIPPMILPVVGPFSGRRVPGKTEQKKRKKLKKISTNEDV